MQRGTSCHVLKRFLFCLNEADEAAVSHSSDAVDDVMLPRSKKLDSNSDGAVAVEPAVAGAKSKLGWSKTAVNFTSHATNVEAACIGGFMSK